MTVEATNVINVFFCYAGEDKDLRSELDKHLSALKRSGFIKSWYDGQINPGADREKEITVHLDTAQLILLLVSPDFMSSEYCYGKEMKRAIERQNAGEARVIPILLRPIDWEGAPFSKLQMLPADNVAVTNSSNRDKAFQDVARGIRKAVMELITPPEEIAQPKAPSPALPKPVPPGAQAKTTSTDSSQTTTPKQRKPSNRSKKSREQWLHEGDTHFVAGDIEKALAAYEQAIHLDPNDAGAYYSKGNALRNLERCDEALATYDQVIELDPNDFLVYFDKGLALDQLERYDEAVAAYEEALVVIVQSIRFDPSSAFDHYNKGIVLRNLERYDEALTAYEEAIHLDPGYADAYNEKGFVLESLGRKREAQRAYDKARKLGYVG